MKNQVSVRHHPKREHDRSGIISNILSQTPVLQQTVLFYDGYRKKVVFRNYNPLLYDVFTTEDGEYDWGERSLAAYLQPEDQMMLNLIASIMRAYGSCNSQTTHFYYFTFVLPLRKKDASHRMILFRVMPVYVPGIEDVRKSSFTYCLLEPADTNYAGGLTLHNFATGDNAYYLLLFKNDRNEYLVLDETELSIFRFAAQGYVESDIAIKLNISYGTFKYLKNKILLQANVQSTAQLVALLTRQGFI